VKGHSNKAPWESIKDLQEQGLNRDKIYNVWYNKLAKQYWVSNASANLEPDPTLAENRLSIPPTLLLTKLLDH